ncbi:MAG: FtsH protease activity modulator HflK [Myxococcota bacterium]|nr:FtsH protease activity modulator HflK [Myxococcota bacterium]
MSDKGGSIRDQLEMLGRTGDGGPPLKTIFSVLAVLGGLAVLNSLFYTVEPEEVGVILRFGEYNRVTEPGLRMKAPAPVEEVIKVPIQRQLKEEFGFRTRESNIRTAYEKGNYLDESLMLTGDLNVAVVEWIAQYRVSDPYQYLFKVRNVRDTFRDLNEAVMRQVVGDKTVNEVLTIGRQAVASEVKQRLQELCTEYETGIKVEQIVLQNVNPPDPVKPSFNEVNQAQQEKERLINEALTAYNKVVPRARGEAKQMLEEAEGYATDRVNRSQGDAMAFKALLEAYERAPEVTRKRIYLETMADVFPKTRGKVIVDNDIDGVLPLLSLNPRGQ